MQESIRRIIQHQYTMEKGSLELSEEKLNLFLHKNEKISGSVEITCLNAEEFRGYVYSSNYRMQCEESRLEGKNVTLTYHFDSMGMEPGDVVKGEFCIVTNLGQYYLPFEAEVCMGTMQSSLGPIRNLFHFINLAKMNWSEAVPLFYSEEFASILEGADKDYLPAYLGLSKYKYNEQNMDEFLLLTNKKKQIQFHLMEEEKRFEPLLTNRKDEVLIEKSGWGYTRLEIETDGDFIEVEKEVLLEADFLGNRCSLSYYVNADKMHEGYNFGRIILKTHTDTLEFHITAVGRNERSKAREYRREKEILILQIMDSYLKFQTGKISQAVWLLESKKVVERVVKLHTNSTLARLYQTQILLKEGSMKEARWMLNHLADMFENKSGEPAEYAYFLYLTSLYEKKEEVTGEIIEQVQALFEKNRNDFRIYYLLLRMDVKRQEDINKTYRELQELFLQGANSPLVYLEAYRILEGRPKFFHKMEAFEVRLLRFAAKYRILSKEIVRQAAYLALKSKENFKEILPILEYGFETFEEEEVLRAICSLLIQNSCTDSKYFIYFEMAVEKNMRITRLYEYYMYTLDLNEKKTLPKSVLMFFSYECSLDYARKAYLYVAALKQKEEIAGIFSSYRQQILAFVCEQIKRQRINKNLVLLYEEFLEEVDFNEELANAFVKMVFKSKVFIEHEDIRNVIVVHEQLNSEEVYPVSEKKAYVSVYTKESCVLLEDSRQNRYVVSRNIDIEPFLLHKKLLYLIENFKLNHLGFFLYLCEDKKKYAAIDVSNVDACAALLFDKQVAEKYKAYIGSRLLKYYYENDYMEELEQTISRLDFMNISYQDRADVMRYMVALDLYDLAFEYAVTYGFEAFSPKTLVRVCNYKVRQLQYKEEYPVVQMCYFAFLGNKYSETMLQYLVDFFDGTIKQMREIWSAAVKMGLNTEVLERRILSQFLFGGGFLSKKEEVFHSYTENVQVIDDLVRAYVYKNSYDFFIREYVIGESLFLEIFKFISAGEELPLVCKLAFLKYYAQKKEGNEPISEEEKNVIKELLSALVEQRIVFSFFFTFKDWVPMLLPCVERVYVEYHAKPGCKVTIHYLISKEGENIDEFTEEVMQEMHDGYYSKSFSLFYSEHLQYYISKLEDGVESLVESAEIEMPEEVDAGRETRYSLLNDILISKALQDYGTVTQLMEEYSSKVWLAEELLQLM